ncbi:hypothetical protein ACE02G_14170 [Shewanella xiamenensis]|uniref:hypothetical protein n=1 Tax=Shewanella xiamenensis TaxID=332186 RepID=UPI00014B59D1
MSTNEPISPPEFSKLFDFLDSETIAARSWLMRYLKKQGVFLNPDLPNIESVKVELANAFSQQRRAPADVRLFARNMRNAWRVRKHRLNKDVTTLSISLDKQVSNQLTQMCKGHNKTEIITRLITHNYPYFLDAQKAEKEKLAEEKQALQMEKERRLRANELQKHLLEIPLSERQLESTTLEVDELKVSIAKLYDILFVANELKQKIDDAMLLEATKVYYSVFSK